MNELVAKLEEAFQKIEDRLGHYLDANSAIPAAAVSGNAVTPGLREELAEAKEVIAELKTVVARFALDEDAKTDDHK